MESTMILKITKVQKENKAKENLEMKMTTNIKEDEQRRWLKEENSSAIDVTKLIWAILRSILIINSNILQARNLIFLLRLEEEEDGQERM